MGNKSSSYGSSSSMNIMKKSKNKRPNSATIPDYETEYSFEPVEDLTLRERELIKKTWNKIEMDAERVGANTFSNLFRMHPSVKDEFIPFKSIEVKDERYNTILQEHGVRVLSTFGKMVRRIDDYESVLPMIRELGSRHGCIYNAKASLVSIMGPHFIRAIQQCLSKDWSPEIEAAYSHMFELLTFHMKQALTKASMNYRAIN